MRLQFHILRSLAPEEEGPLLEGVPRGDTTRRVLIWPGLMPAGKLPSRSRFGTRAAQGVTNSRPVWVEERPLGPLLSDLEFPLPTALADYITLQVCQGLELLHQRGKAHGDLRTDRIALEAQGRPVILGTERRPGSPEDDLTNLLILHEAIGGSPIPAATSMDSLIQALSQAPPPQSDQLSTIMKATPVLAASPSALEVMIRTDTSDSSIDEVGFDLGPDERGTGILDDWTGHTDESSAEQTGTLSLSDVAEQRRLALLSRLGMDPKIRTVPAHIQALDGPPLPGIRERIQLEYLDPLPSPGTIDAPQNPVHGETQEVEVTHSRPGSLLPASHQDDETAARFEPTDSFGSTSEVTRIRPRPVPEQAPEPRRFGSLIWLTLTGWLLALGALFMIWYRSGGGR